jgi:putative DNA methylase
MPYPKRLIEVDLPIKRISAHARREKSIRHGHISTLHIWWARRPLAACRAVICASLWPDPVDELCPQDFRVRATEIMTKFAKKAGSTSFTGALSEESSRRWIAMAKGTVVLDAANPDHWQTLRYALLDFIADFANWDNSTQEDYLETSRALTQVAHEALGGEPGTRPLVVDPFAGGGSIPLEALRVGADAFASDLNPVAVLLNKVVLEYIPKYGQRLADEVRKWGQWVKEEAEKELAEFYPKDPDGSTPIAYLWARTITCEGPGCGAEIPLLRSLWLSKKKNELVAFRLSPDSTNKRICISIPGNISAKDVQEGTTRKGSATCPCCGYTTPAPSVKRQLKERHGGTRDARLLAVVNIQAGKKNRDFRLPLENDLLAVKNALERVEFIKKNKGDLIPEESTKQYHSFVNRGPIYGMTKWEDFFTPRQLIALTTLSSLVQVVGRKLEQQDEKKVEDEFSLAVQTCLALVVNRVADRCSSLCRYDPSPTMSGINNTFGRQALPMVWDFGEGDPTSDRSGGWNKCLSWLLHVMEREAIAIQRSGVVESASATLHPLPNDSANALFTDPPYYYSVQYGDLSDFFYIWLKRSLKDRHSSILESELVLKDDEIIVQSPGHEFSKDGKNNAFYESHMQVALSESRRILAPSGIGVVVFAHTSTGGWEALLQAMIGAGLTITASWPIDTEMSTRIIAQGRSVLASSVHLVCRPREHTDGSLRTEIGDWRDVLQELPQRIHDWMPRLAKEGVVGADAIFACLGPALEIFSRYSSVEKASGEEVTLREYLEYVWGAVSKEALGMIFTDADTTDFEEDARLTAMWLWTLSAGNEAPGAEPGESGEEDDDEDDDGGRSGKSGKSTGYTLEYDAARKIAQGLGAHLDKLTTLVEIKGDKARLLPVSERAQALFGKEDLGASTSSRKKKSKDKQLDLFAVLGPPEDSDNSSFGDPGVPQIGKTILDRLHQSMILFAAGRSEALKRFLVEEGIGADQRYWKLAQAFSALYPTGTDEKRWVDGVLARKKGLGF